MVCPSCGKQVKDLACAQPAVPNITINNANTSSNVNTATATAVAGGRAYGPRGKRVNKMTALLLCIFLGWAGAHKFYEGRTGSGVLYLFTGGLFLIGWICDIIAIAVRPGPCYYVDVRHG